MKRFLVQLVFASLILTPEAMAQAIENASFENEWDGWRDIDPEGGDTAISEDARTGSKSAKVTGQHGRFEQTVDVSQWSDYELKAHVRGAGQVGLHIQGETFATRSENHGEEWATVSLPFSTESASEATIFGAFADGEARFDDFELIRLRSKSEDVASGSSGDAQPLEDPVIRILGAGLSSDLSEILKDVADVTSDETGIRVLSILGDGSLNNLNDLLYLQGIDAALVPSDVLLNFRAATAVRNLENKLSFIAQLGAVVTHLLAHESNRTIYSLAGKRVYMGERSSGSFITASNIFDRLNIGIDAVFGLDHAGALAQLKAGELDAVFWMDVPPIGLLNLVDPSEDLHLIHIPTQGIDPDVYQIQQLTSDDYRLIGEEDIQSAAAQIALIAYAWPNDHPRHAKMKRFAGIFADKTEALQSGDYHRVLNDADFYSEVYSGWEYYQ